MTTNHPIVQQAANYLGLDAQDFVGRSLGDVLTECEDYGAEIAWADFERALDQVIR